MNSNARKTNGQKDREWREAVARGQQPEQLLDEGLRKMGLSVRSAGGNLHTVACLDTLIDRATEFSPDLVLQAVRLCLTAWKPGSSHYPWWMINRLVPVLSDGYDEVILVKAMKRKRSPHEWRQSPTGHLDPDAAFARILETYHTMMSTTVVPELVKNAPSNGFRERLDLLREAKELFPEATLQELKDLL